MNDIYKGLESINILSFRVISSLSFTDVLVKSEMKIKPFYNDKNIRIPKETW